MQVLCKLLFYITGVYDSAVHLMKYLESESHAMWQLCLATVIFSYLVSLATEMSLVDDNSNRKCCLPPQPTLVNFTPSAQRLSVTNKTLLPFRLEHSQYCRWSLFRGVRKVGFHSREETAQRLSVTNLAKTLLPLRLEHSQYPSERKGVWEWD